MPLYDFECPDCGVFEAFARRDEDTLACACGETAVRLSVYRVGFTGFARTPIDQREIKMGAFKEAGAELEYQHSRQTNIDGSLKPKPPLWQTAKREAKRLQKLGVKDSADLR